jgi:hypothetical protein
MISKINIILIALVGILTFGLFVVWRNNVQKTKQLQEITKQYQYLVEHPKIEYKEGPVKIVQGPVRVVEKVVIKYSSGSIVSSETETITEISTTTIETSGTSYASEPVTIQQTQGAKQNTSSILVGYGYNDEILISLNREFFTRVVIGLGIDYNWTRSDVKPMVILQYKF